MFINRNCSIVSQKHIVICDGVTIGPNVCVYDHDHDLQSRGNFISADITIGKNVWIGANATILKGVTIGHNSVIGAGTIISKDIPDNTVCYNRQNLIMVDRRNI